MERTQWDELGARKLELSGNELMILEGDSTLRFVESGSVALFCVELKEGAPAGPRRLLHRIGSGQTVLSVPCTHAGGLRLLMVPIRESVIREVPLAALWKEPTGNGRADLVDEWVDLLARVFDGMPGPDLPMKISDSQEIELDDEQSLCGERGRVLWCRVRRGSVRCMGAGQETLGEASGVFPLGAGMWVVADGAAQLSVLVTSEVDDVTAIEGGLVHLHEMALDRLNEIERTEMAEELARLEERDRKQEEASEQALGDLANVLDPRIRPALVTLEPMQAAMAAVGRELGAEIRPASKSEQLSGSSNELQAIARASGIRVRRVTLAGRWWKRDCGPLVGFSADGERRPLALLRRGRQRYEIWDPEEDTYRPVDSSTAGGLAPEAEMLYRPLPEGKLVLLDLFKFSMKNRRNDMLLVIVTGIAATLLGMLTPQATAILMDQAIPDANRRLLLELGAGLLAAAFGQATFYLSQGIVLLRIGTRSEADTQAALWDRLLRLRASFFRKYSSGDLESRVMAVNEVGRDLSGVLLTAVFSGFLAVLNLALLWYYSSSLVLLAVGIAVVLFAFTLTMSLFIRRNLRELLELDGSFFGMVIQLINGVSKLRVAGAEDRAYGHWIKGYTRMLRLRNEAQRLTDFVHLFNVALPTIGTILLYWFAYEMLIDGRRGGSGISLGIFLAFSAAFGTFLSGMSSLSGTVVGFLDTLVKGRRTKPILDELPEVDAAKADPGRLTGRVDVEGLDFRYGPEGPKILDGIDLHVEAGEFVAIVGPSGSGKSTLLRMLLGFETPASGAVKFDGQELANLDVLAVRRQLGVVLQNGKLDAGSILENIASGNVITLDEAWAAAEDAGLAPEIREMPMGMHTVMSVGGGNLSGGQRQRLLIARALATRPRLLLFDEATSALDNRTQAIVSESLERLRVTRVVIAHRLSTIRQADRIYVIEGGRLVQQGSFEELMSQEGLFARMMARQVA